MIAVVLERIKAQGATEYLVLLAVVLIVALVSVALLGFFPGMASDAQLTQSKAYWSSASPVSIIEMDAKYYIAGTSTTPYLRIRNSGVYPIRVTKLISPGSAISGVWDSATKNISDYFYMGPGEEKYFGSPASGFTGSNQRLIYVYLASAIGNSALFYLPTQQSECQNSASPGTMAIDGFGFEYVEYIGEQQITKRQIGAKPLLVKCTNPA